MNRFYPLLLVALGALSVAAQEQQEDPPRLVVEVQKQMAPANLNIEQALGQQLLIPLAEGAELKCSATIPAPAVPREATPSDIAGKWAMIYSSLSANCVSSGSSAIISAAGADSVLVQNFWISGANLKMGVNADGTLSIPSQTVINYGTYGDLYIASVDKYGTPHRDVPVKGVVSADGSIVISDWWGIFTLQASQGVAANALLGGYAPTILRRANATMTYSRELSDGTSASYSALVYAEQNQGNVLSVTNFFNAGQTVEFVLNHDRTSTIEYQPALYTLEGTWYTIGALRFNDAGNLSGFNFAINAPAAAQGDDRSISWSNWSLFCPDESMYYGKMNTGAITFDFDLRYPTFTATEFEGSGTEGDPYIISTPDHIALLAHKVNADTELYYGLFTKSYLGKHFRVANDIDMKGLRTAPIGQALSNRFAGTFDGNGKTIYNLNINTYNRGMAGLFGCLDTLASVKNLTLESPRVHTANQFAGTIAAFSYAPIANCHARNIDVFNNTMATGGIVGVCGNDITDCTVDGGSLTSMTGYAGGITGEIDLHTLSGCHVDNVNMYVASGTNTYPNGGVVGYNYGSTVEKSSFTGTIDGSITDTGMPLGGVAGTVYAGYVDQCFFAGTVKNFSINNDAVTGGLVGSLAGNLTNSYSIGRVYGYANSASGGLTGTVKVFAIGANVYQCTVKNCYTATSLVADTYLYDTAEGVRETLGLFGTNAAPTIANIYFDRKITNLKSEKYGSTTELLTSPSGPDGFDASLWTYTEGQYPRLKCQDSTPAALFSASAVMMHKEDNLTSLSRNATLRPLGNTRYALLSNGVPSSQGGFCSIEGNELKLGAKLGKDTLVVCNGSMANASYIWPIDVAPIFLEGEGTQDSPFLVKTADDLVKLSVSTTTDKQLFTGKYFLMTNDIDLEYREDYIGICTDALDAYNKFAGVFDGGGHTIHRMWIKGVAWKVKPEDANGLGTPDTDNTFSYRGFMGRLADTGVIRNLNIAADCRYDGWGHVGAFVGNTWGLVENCRNYADITGYSANVGGIVGRMNKGSIVRNCYNAGRVRSGYQETGGIAASCAGLVENCVNTGDVSASQLSNFIKDGDSRLNTAGGIIARGDGAVLRNVVNFGTVYARVSMAGGISGRLIANSSGSGSNDVSNALNLGMVYTADQALIGGIGGQGGTQGELKYNHWDAQILPLKALGNADQNGMSGIGTTTLTSGAPLEGYDADIWSFEAGKYPVLSMFKDEAGVALKRALILNIASSEQAYDIHSPATLSAPQGVEWKLAFGNAFSITDANLMAPANVTTMVVDTLLACYEGATLKPIEIRSAPAVPLEGRGTFDNPYIIATAEHWNALVDFIASSGKDMEGTYTAIVADIDFSSTTFKPMADNGATYFQGFMLGRGHALKNINYATTKTYSGIFGVIGDKGVVKNLTFEGNITSAFNYTGGIAGKMYGELDSVVCNVNITSTKPYVGGIASYGYYPARLSNVECRGKISVAGSTVGGFFASTSAQPGITYTDCLFTGVLEGTATTSTTYGGFVGVGAPATFTRCSNKGVIKFTTAANATAVAGFVANPTSTADTLVYLFDRCENHALITGKAKLAGFTGAITASKTVLHFDSCINYADITALSTTAVSTAPVVGVAAEFTLGFLMKDCYNYGKIAGAMQQYVAGLVGRANGNPTEARPAIVRNSHNLCESVQGVSYVAGVMGFGSTYTMLEHCSNAATIKGSTFGTGGVAGGYSGTYSVIDGCWNTGSVTSDLGRTGGLVGMNGPTAGGYVRNSWNAGHVKTLSTAQGTTTSTSGYAIGGIAGTGAATYLNCYNLGAVEGASQIGGLVGQPSVNRTSFYNCYNAGRIIAPSDTCGNICGTSLANAVIWKDGDKGSNRMENVWYVTDYGTVSRDDYGTPLTRANLARLASDSVWTSADRYSFPMLRVHAEREEAVLHSAQPVFAGRDTEESVTSDFHVGSTGNVIWSITPSDAAVLSDNSVLLKKGYIGTIMLTATLGTKGKTHTLKVQADGSGVDTPECGALVEELYFDATGCRVIEPLRGEVYIVMRRYADGSVKTFRELKQ